MSLRCNTSVGTRIAGSRSRTSNSRLARKRATAAEGLTFERSKLAKIASHLGEDSLNAVSIALVERYQRTLRAAGLWMAARHSVT